MISDIDDCRQNPCLHEGACTDGINSYSCECANGFGGKNCNISKATFLFTYQHNYPSQNYFEHYL